MAAEGPARTPQPPLGERRERNFRRYGENPPSLDAGRSVTLAARSFHTVCTNFDNRCERSESSHYWRASRRPPRGREAPPIADNSFSLCRHESRRLEDAPRVWPGISQPEKRLKIVIRSRNRGSELATPRPLSSVKKRVTVYLTTHN